MAATMPARKASRKPRRRKRAVAAEAARWPAVTEEHPSLAHITVDDMPDGEAEEAALLAALAKVPPKPDWKAPLEDMSEWLKATLAVERLIHEALDYVRINKGSMTHVHIGSVLAAADDLDVDPLASEMDALAIFEPNVVVGGLLQRLAVGVARRIRLGRFAARKKASAHGDLMCAMVDVDAIRRLWKTHYGRKNRSKYLPSAEAIAADWHGVTVKSLKLHLKKKREAEAAARQH